MDAPTLGSTRAVAALASGQRTGDFAGDGFITYWVSGDPMNSDLYDDYTGWSRNATVFVAQTTGSGNNGGNYLLIQVQGRHRDTDPWATYTFANSGEIKITTNVATGYYARVEGPLMPQMRVIGTETGVADATFSVEIFLEA